MMTVVLREESSRNWSVETFANGDRLCCKKCKRPIRAVLEHEPVEGNEIPCGKVVLGEE